MVVSGFVTFRVNLSPALGRRILTGRIEKFTESLQFVTGESLRNVLCEPYVSERFGECLCRLNNLVGPLVSHFVSPMMMSP
jgi:hypothetical protein